MWPFKKKEETVPIKEAPIEEEPIEEESPWGKEPPWWEEEPVEVGLEEGKPKSRLRVSASQVEAGEFAKKLAMAKTQAELSTLLTGLDKAQFELEKSKRAEEHAREMRKWERRKAGAERRKRVRGEVSDIAEKLHLQGPKLTSAERRELYFGRGKKESLYQPSVPELRLSEIPAKEALRPDLGELKKRGEFPVRPTSLAGLGPLARAVVPQPMGLISIKGQSVALGLLREAGMPKGLSPIERFAYAEIVGNNDRDTVQHVISELRALGISGTEAQKAIVALLQKGLVRKTRDFKGEEPILEVAR